MERATRYSRKREAILAALRSTRTHPTAEWIYQALKPEHQDLSLGTVYRNLALFQQQGLIRSVGVVDGHERFDAFTAPHSHFICTCCRAVIDLPELPPDEALNHAVSEQYGFAVDYHDLTFYGICDECMQSQEKHQKTGGKVS